MSKRKNVPQAQQNSVPVIVMVIGGIVAVSLLVWALSRSMKPPVSAGEPAAQAAAVPTQQAALPASPATDDVGNAPRITIDEFKKLYDANQVHVLDVRDIDAYAASHIRNTMQIPLSRVEGEIPYLPKDKLIVTYCTCPAEESSGAAAIILERGGIKAAALKGGFQEWVSRGLPVEAGVPAPQSGS